MTARPARILELYAGLGGCAIAVGDDAEIVAAVEVDRDALAAYRANLPHRTLVKNLEFIPFQELARFEADLWWLSPPCQPYTVKGLRRDDTDPRAQSLLHLIDGIAAVKPAWLALENVPGFAGSRTHGRLRDALAGAGYEVRETLLCPSELGWPNRRRRFYLIAALGGGLAPEPSLPAAPLRPLSGFLDREPDPALRLAPEVVERYRGALDRVEADDPQASTACFASGYGRQVVRSGSYLVEPDGTWRRFSPAEILRLLGFPDTYRLPSELPLVRAYDLVGNSLSIPAVRRVLAGLGVHGEERKA